MCSYVEDSSSLHCSVFPLGPQLFHFFPASVGPTSMDLNYSPEHLAMAHGAGDRGFSGSLHSPFVRLKCASMGISQHCLDILCSHSALGV